MNGRGRRVVEQFRGGVGPTFEDAPGALRLTVLQDGQRVAERGQARIIGDAAGDRRVFDTVEKRRQIEQLRAVFEEVGVEDLFSGTGRFRATHARIVSGLASATAKSKRVSFSAVPSTSCTSMALPTARTMVNVSRPPRC